MEHPAYRLYKTKENKNSEGYIQEKAIDLMVRSDPRVSFSDFTKKDVHASAYIQFIEQVWRLICVIP